MDTVIKVYIVSARDEVGIGNHGHPEIVVENGRLINVIYTDTRQIEHGSDKGWVREKWMMARRIVVSGASNWTPLKWGDGRHEVKQRDKDQQQQENKVGIPWRH